MSQSSEIDWQEVIREINVDWKSLRGKEKDPAKLARLRKVMDNTTSAEKQYTSGQYKSGEFYLALACDLVARCLPDGSANSVGRDRKLYFLVIAQKLYTKLGSTNEARQIETAIVQLKSEQEGVEGPIPPEPKKDGGTSGYVIEPVAQKVKEPTLPRQLQS